MAIFHVPSAASSFHVYLFSSSSSSVLFYFFHLLFPSTFHFFNIFYPLPFFFSVISFTVLPSCFSAPPPPPPPTATPSPPPSPASYLSQFCSFLLDARLSSPPCSIFLSFRFFVFHCDIAELSVRPDGPNGCFLVCAAPQSFFPPHILTRLTGPLFLRFKYTSHFLHSLELGQSCLCFVV